MNDEPHRKAPRLPWSAGLCTLLVIAGFFLWNEHRAHVLGALPYLLVLACPIIHLLMHRGHGHGEHRHTDSDHAHGAKP